MPVESVSVTLGGKPCLDPFTAADEAARLGIPVDSWIDKANSFTCPLGPAPGRGWVLMTRKEADTLDAASLHDLKFSCSGDQEVTLKNLIFVRAIFVGPTIQDDPNGLCLVEVSDKRLWARLSCLDSKQYNVRTPNPGTTMFAWSQNAGTNWTWQTLIADVFTSVPLFTVTPALPMSSIAFVGEPNNFRFVGVPAWDAANAVLETIGCAVAYDPMADTAKIVAVGDTTAGSIDEAATSNRSRLLYDAGAIVNYQSQLPFVIHVFFNATDYRIGTDATVLTAQDQWESHPAYVAGTENGTGVPNGILPLWGDMIALYDGNAADPTNKALLDQRAQEIANEYVRKITDGGKFLHRIYSGALPDFKPQADVSAVRWSAQAGRGIYSGMTTEVLRVPYFLDNPGSFPKPGFWPECPEVRDAFAPPRLSRGRMSSFRVICFELTAALTSGGSAAANIKKWNGTAWANSGATTTVWDFVGALATVASGKKGIAFLHEQSGKYVIVAYQC